MYVYIYLSIYIYIHNLHLFLFRLSWARWPGSMIITNIHICIYIVCVFVCMYLLVCAWYINCLSSMNHPVSCELGFIGLRVNPVTNPGWTRHFVAQVFLPPVVVLQSGFSLPVWLCEDLWLTRFLFRLLWARWSSSRIVTTHTDV